MTEVIAGQPVVLLAQFYDVAGGTLTDLDATPTITITAIATGTTALAATSSGVTHPGVGSYGYAWTPGSTLTPGAYLATWSGLKAGSPVTASETVTVTAPASADSTGTDPSGIWYATREEIKAELDVKETARSDARIDRALEDASRAVESMCHRRFYPVQATRYFDWPDSQYRPSWRIWLDDSQLISLTAASSGGETLDVADLLLEPIRTGPPFSRIEVNIGSSAAWTSGDTHQRAVAITGLWGYRNNETSAGTLAEALDDSETGVDVDGAASAAVGIGSVIRIDSERMLVTGRRQLATGQTLGADLTNLNNATSVTVQNGAAFAAGEVILVDAEKMRVDDVAGNTLIVTRPWDGTTLAAHTTSATIYAPRTLTVTRGALGTTAALHGSATSVSRWDPPGPIRQLTVAEAITDLLQGRSGYARTAGSGENQREAYGRALQDLRDRVSGSELCRKARTRGV